MGECNVKFGCVCMTVVHSSLIPLILPLLSNTQTPARDRHTGSLHRTNGEWCLQNTCVIFTDNYVDMSIVCSKYWKLYLHWWSIQVCSICMQALLLVRAGREPWWLGAGSSLASLDRWIKLICLHVGMWFWALVITNGEYNKLMHYGIVRLHLIFSLTNVSVRSLILHLLPPSLPGAHRGTSRGHEELTVSEERYT